MAAFLKVCKFEIFDEETGEWAPTDNWWTEGKTIYEGPRGGQYYYNSNGNKTYVKKQ